MDPAVLKAKIGAHRRRFAPSRLTADVSFIGVAFVRGWRLDFGLYSAGQRGRVADIQAGKMDDEVWGAVYELPLELIVRDDGARSVMDRVEGHRTERDPENYVPRLLTVDVGGTQSEAWTYVGRPEARQRCATEHADAVVPRDYARSLLEAAAALALPIAYQKHLEKAVVDPVDT